MELCCLFDLISRAPLRFIYGKVCASEHKLVLKLIPHLKKGDLLLPDSGFYFCATFVKILLRHAHFIIPTKTTTRPRVVRKLADGDYLCEIKDSYDKTTLTVRVAFVHRDGFRLRRLVTSLLDNTVFPAPELARLYHLRWDIETFYRDFKHSLRATSWHCQTPISFHKELLVHMIALCLIRIAMLEAQLPDERLRGSAQLCTCPHRDTVVAQDLDCHCRRGPLAFHLGRICTMLCSSSRAF